jgi:hypothetical protein
MFVDNEVLWLSDPKTQNLRQPLHAILWPAYEFTALVYGDSQNSGTKLDLFERAIIGAINNNMLGKEEQAAFLHLQLDFVSHIHDCLQEKRLLSEDGKLRKDKPDLLEDQTQIAIRMYQDPWSGNLWPRYVDESWRRTMPVSRENHILKVIAGSTGRPLEIKAFVVEHPDKIPAIPSSDDAAEVMTIWGRYVRRNKIRNVKVPANGPIKILPKSRQVVHLCCFNDRGSSGRPAVHDPFGGSSWARFTFSLKAQASDSQNLAHWLYGAQENEFEIEQDTDASVLARAIQIVSRINVEGAHSVSLIQLCADLEALGHEAIDLLWKYGTENVESLLLGPESDAALALASCNSCGFDTINFPKFIEIASDGSGNCLTDRFIGMLLRYRMGTGGRIHGLARRHPEMLNLLLEVDRTVGSPRTDRLAKAVVALAESAAENYKDVTIQGDISYG